MTKLETIKQNYSRALERHRIKNPVLTPIEKLQTSIICGMCGASVKRIDIKEHMQKHAILPEPGLMYQLTEPFRTVNGKIAKGAKFIKLLWIVSTARICI